MLLSYCLHLFFYEQLLEQLSVASLHIYEGHSINKLQNFQKIPSVLKIGKIRNIRFVGNFILNIHATFLSDDIIVVMSADNRTQSIFVSFSPYYFLHPISRTDGMAPFCNLFMERPSYIRLTKG